MELKNIFVGFNAILASKLNELNVDQFINLGFQPYNDNGEPIVVNDFYVTSNDVVLSCKFYLPENINVTFIDKLLIYTFYQNKGYFSNTFDDDTICHRKDGISIDIEPITEVEYLFNTIDKNAVNFSAYSLVRILRDLINFTEHYRLHNKI